MTAVTVWTATVNGKERIFFASDSFITSLQISDVFTVDRERKLFDMVAQSTDLKE